MRMSWTKESGVTLTELMVVLAIIAVGAAISFPLIMSSFPHYSLRSAARNVVKDMRLAQGLAMKQSTGYQIQFDVDADTYEIKCATDPDPDDVCSSDPPPLPRDLGAPGIGSIDIVSVSDTVPMPQNLIVFGGGGSVLFPTGNFPITIQLKTKKTDEIMEVDLFRVGRFKTVVP